MPGWVKELSQIDSKTEANTRRAAVARAKAQGKLIAGRAIRLARKAATMKRELCYL
jgi:hypothetical protein